MRVEYRQTARGHEPVHRDGGVPRRGAVGHRERDRAARRRARATRRRGDGASRLPRTLARRDGAACKSAAAREILGRGFVDHYVRTREWEVRQYERAVTDWELERYFELI